MIGTRVVTKGGAGCGFEKRSAGSSAGLTEFVPVSSSAHLVVLGRLLRRRAHSLSFDVAVPGCVLALLVCFGREWAQRGRPLGAATPAATAGHRGGCLCARVCRGRALEARPPSAPAASGRAHRRDGAAAHRRRSAGARGATVVGWRRGADRAGAGAGAAAGVSRSGSRSPWRCCWGFPAGRGAVLLLLATPMLVGAAIWGLRRLPARYFRVTSGFPSPPASSRPPWWASSPSAGCSTTSGTARRPFGCYRLLFAAAIFAYPLGRRFQPLCRRPRSERYRYWNGAGGRHDGVGAKHGGNLGHVPASRPAALVNSWSDVTDEARRPATRACSSVSEISP